MKRLIDEKLFNDLVQLFLTDEKVRLFNRLLLCEKQDETPPKEAVELHEKSEE